MSSALAMILTAAMAVPASGPEKVSGEVEQGLDLRGEWEGLLWKEQGDFIWVDYRDLEGSKAYPTGRENSFIEGVLMLLMRAMACFGPRWGGWSGSVSINVRVTG